MGAQLQQRIKGLLADPPIRDRLTWRGILTPSPEEGSDPAVKASTFGVMLTGGSLLAVVGTAAGLRIVDSAALMIVVAVISLILGATCLVGYRQLPDWFFVLTAGAAIGLVSLAAAAARTGSEAVFAPLFAIVVLATMMLLRGRPAAALTLLAALSFGVLMFTRNNRNDFELLLTTTAMIAAFAGVIGTLRTRGTAIHGELSNEAMTDQLTGIPNRRSFDERLELERERTRRSQSQVGLIICDLDHFKQVNDQHGHDVGDQVLRLFAASLVESVREIDLPARVGGEEFAIILPDATITEARTAASRIQEDLAENVSREPISATASFGVASAGPDERELDRLYKRADRAMYEAKRAGRNCIAIAVDDERTEIIGAAGNPLTRLRRMF